jgi:hypothetical protein
MIKSGRIRFVWNVTRMKGNENSQRRKPEAMRGFFEKWKVGGRRELKGTGWECVEWIIWLGTGTSSRLLCTW